MAATTIRPCLHADAPCVVDVLNAASLRALGQPRAAIDAFGGVRKTRWISPAALRVVAEVGGEVVGYAYLAASPPYVVCEMGGSVHPDVWRQGVGSALVGWAEAHASEVARCAPAGVRVVLQAPLFEDEREARALLARAGFHIVRTWVHRAVELDAPPQVHAPDGVLIRPMDLDADWDAVGPAMDDAFADHWGALIESFDVVACAAAVCDPADEDDTYSNTPGLCFVAEVEGEVAGCVLCNGKVIGQPGVGRVGSLSVRPRHRRRGVGRALMLAAFDAFWQRGVRRIITDTDADSLTDANSLYARLGMQVYAREHTYEKEVRPGREVRRLT